MAISRFLTLFAVSIPMIVNPLNPADGKDGNLIGGSGLRSAISAPTPEPRPPFSKYRNIAIGMKADDVRISLGEPKVKSNTDDFYMFGDNESLEIVYGPDQLVTAISITIFNDLSKAPTARDVLGEDARPDANGAIFKLVRFPKAGFWISYSKTAGENPSISITLQKI